MNKFKTIAIYISLLAFSLSGYAAGDADYVWLTVSNAMSGEPIEGVSITVEQAYIGETGPLGRILIPEGMPGQLIALYHTSYAAGYYSMKELQDLDYPEYGFAGHKGYASAKHIEALRTHGPSPIHRVTWLTRIMA